MTWRSGDFKEGHGISKYVKDAVCEIYIYIDHCDS